MGNAIGTVLSISRDAKVRHGLVADEREPMPDERLRMPIHPDYITAVGLAAYCLAGLEWQAVWCCEGTEPGIIERLEDRTAGRVADTFVALVGKLEPSDAQAEL